MSKPFQGERRYFKDIFTSAENRQHRRLAFRLLMFVVPKGFYDEATYFAH
jgi:hypothetical protein